MTIKHVATEPGALDLLEPVGELSGSQLKSYQAKALNQISEWVATHSRYWEHSFFQQGLRPQTVNSPEDLPSAPTLSKRDFMDALNADYDNYGGFLCYPLQDVLGRGAIVYRSTGTSGRQARFVNSHEGFEVYGDEGAYMMLEAGAQPGDSVMIMFPLGFWALGWGCYYAARRIRCTLLPGGAPTDTLMRLHLIQEYKPSVVVMTPSYALTLARAAEAEGVRLPECGIKGLLLGGETFSAAKRDLIEELWGVPGGSRNFYGISEGGPLFAVECREQNGMHLFEQDAVHQFWEPGSRNPVHEGQVGELVLTALRQRVMATWFNFRTGDAASYTAQACRCGRTAPRMWIHERLDDMVKVKGVNIFASAVEEIIRSMPALGEEFRLVAERAQEQDVVTVQVESGAADQAALAEELRRRLRAALGVSLQTETLTLGSLPRTELKAKRWIDRRTRD